MGRAIPKLHLYHIPRTGGTSINLFLRRHNVVNGVKHIAYHIDGHTHYRGLGPSYFTIIGIRDPVDHVASLYKYISRSRSHSESSRVSRMTFQEYIAYSSDSYLGFLTSKHDRSVERAISNLSQMSLVYLTSNLDSDLRIFFRYLGAGIRWRNTRFNTTRPMKITKSHVAAVRAKRSADFRIFEAAKRLNAAQLRFFRKHRRDGMLPDLDWSEIIV